ncbi:MAG: hypothetical protein KJP14_12450 [Eudoraea sp.]|nr:hypothetical protein [Eudoraea sp.]NNK30462.1 hypothetical protein [Flavobacteriaceae bacterium]MBT8204313.1 hypothetical protein [Eudoraea sp.]MBT8211328.1 hypothetical protein [Eudoraea sp.]MBT8322066.1 hypothetical protein [Eudoraea sp.]
MTPPILYRKALDLCELSRAIASYVTYNKDLLKLYQSNSLRDIIADSLLTDAILIPQQIARAEKSDNPVVRFRTARFISVMLKNIQGYTNGLENDGVKEQEYLNLLRKEIKSFQKAFKKWRKSLGSYGDEGQWGYQDYLGY